MSTRVAIATQLVDRLHQFLEPYSFDHHEKSYYEGKVKHTWTKRMENLQHRVYAHYYVRYPSDIAIGLTVYATAGKEEVIIAGTSLGTIQKKAVFYRIPVFLMSLRASRFIKTVISDLEKGLAWFQPYTREHCLQLLLSGEAATGRKAVHFNQVVESLGGTVQ